MVKRLQVILNFLSKNSAFTFPAFSIRYLYPSLKFIDCKNNNYLYIDGLVCRSLWKY